MQVSKLSRAVKLKFLIQKYLLFSLDLACVAVVSVSFKDERRARALGKKEQKSRSGGEGRGRKGKLAAEPRH